MNMLSRFVLGAGIVIVTLDMAYGVLSGLGLYRSSLPPSIGWALFFLVLAMAGILVYGVVLVERRSLAVEDMKKIRVYLTAIILGTLLLSAQFYFGYGNGNALDLFGRMFGIVR